MTWAYAALFIVWCSSPIWTFLLCRRYWRPRTVTTRMGAEVVQYDPPDDLRPVEALLLLERRLTTVAMASPLFDLAWRGYLTTKDGKTRRRKPDDADLRPFETYLLKALFPGGEREIDTGLLEYRWLNAIGSDRFTKLIYESLRQAGYVSTGTFNASVACVLGGFALMAVGLFAATFVTGLAPWTPLLGIAAVVDGLILVASAKGWISWTQKGWEKAGDLRGYRDFLRETVPASRMPMDALTQFGPHLPYAYAFGRGGAWYGSLPEAQGGEILRMRFPFRYDIYEKNEHHRV